MGVEPEKCDRDLLEFLESERIIMSGIVGIYYLNDRPVERQNLRRMVNILAHRGPDGVDIWYSGSIGLGHRMLWTTPESLVEKLPLVDSTGKIVITADARIDNRSELISTLNLNDRPLPKITDSELILAAYVKWGQKCPEKLLGDFAFAIWDGRKNELFCARDYIGVKPFYYYYKPGNIFAFASEIKALLCLAEVPRKINEAKIGIFLCQLKGFAALNHKTFYQDIFRFPPANLMTLGEKGLHFQPFWDLDAAATKIQEHLKSDAEYVEAFRERFTEAINCRLRSAYPIVASLSGGLDSSSVSCVARNILREKNGELPTIYADCGVPATKEKIYVNAVLAQGGFKHDIARVTGVISSGKIVTPWLDQPVQKPLNTAIVLATLQLVQNMGARVLLTGHDGDTIVSHGRDYPEEVESDNGDGLKARFLTYLKQGKSPDYISLQNLIDKGLIKSSYVGLYRKNKVRERLVNPKWQEQNSTISYDWAKEIGLEQLIEDEINYQFAYLPTEYLNHYRAITSDNIQIVSEQTDGMSSALGIETRHPFFDQRVIELCLAVPGKMKYESGLGRGVMRRGMENILPEEVRKQPAKIHFYGFIMEEVKGHESKLMEELLFNKPLDLSRYVDVDGLKKEKQEFFNSEHTWEVRRRKAQLLDCTSCLAMWLSEVRNFNG